jgi:hypothetical protein
MTHPFFLPFFNFFRSSTSFRLNIHQISQDFLTFYTGWTSSRKFGVLTENCLYTVIIFLARNGRIRAVKFRAKNFGRNFSDLGEISLNQQILRLSNGRNSPKLGEIHPKFLRANLNCADSPISNKFHPKKNYCVQVQMDQDHICAWYHSRTQNEKSDALVGRV